MRIVSSLLAAGVLSLAAISSASAANDVCYSPLKRPVGQITSITGSVMVDRGNGFEPATVGMKLRAGDKISVIGDGSAVFGYISRKPLTVASSSTKTICATESTSAVTPTVDPTLGIAATIGTGVGVAAAISTTEGKSGTVFFPVSP
ncbi:hypothetical protein [Ancylobacter dichloromethanicus]|uniref:Uncharacterized protein n=2 Tax=Ancylobacter dichloromethanicus TaxID=518825 RepID=A0A9W6JD50_9HYPH|nr:hypothetical protein [Ancylobacter dichloromethanicus]GLK74133.1 hypothetical protein GCM10017643_42510 [Ancylobacter dichloromethanicus]